MKRQSIIPYFWTQVTKPGLDRKVILTTRNGEIETDKRSFKLPTPYQDTSTAHVKIYQNMIKFHVPAHQPKHLVGIKRGAISLEFNGKMRKRFLDRFNAWHVPNENMYMLHLTYPNDYDEDWHTWKLHLKIFKSQLARKFPHAQGWWKLELQRRGAPHFHMIIDLCQKCSVKNFRKWCDAVWARIAHSVDQYGGKYACRVETVWSVRHARNYVCKYMGKLSYAPVDEWGEIQDSSNMRDTMGRMWGRIGKPNCDQTDAWEVDIQSVTWMRLHLAHELKKRGARGWRHLVSTTGVGSFTIYGLGTMSDERHKSASVLIWELIDKWQKPYANDPAELWRLDELIMGQGG